MKIKVTITKSLYEEAHRVKSTGEVRQQTTFVGRFIDEEGSTNYVTFYLAGQKMHEANLAEGDNVFVRINLNLRNWNGISFNDVSSCYYIGKAEEPASVPTPSSNEENVHPNIESQGCSRNTTSGKGDLPF